MNNIGNRSIHELIMRMPCLAWPIGSTVSGKPFLQCSYFLDGRATSWRKNCLLIELLQLFQSQHLHGIGYHVLIFRIHDWILVPTNGCRNELANGQWKSSTEPPFLIDITNEGLVKKKCPKVCVTNIPPFYLILLQHWNCEKATIRSVVSLRMRHSLQNEIRLPTERLNLLSNAPIIRVCWNFCRLTWMCDPNITSSTTLTGYIYITASVS